MPSRNFNMVLLGLCALFVFGCNSDHDTANIFSIISVNEESPGEIFYLNTVKNSFFLLDSKGRLVPEKIEGKDYYKSGQNEYVLKRKFNTRKTALIVMDPWEDSGSDILNKHFRPVLRNKLIPLVLKAVDWNIPVIALTNDPDKKSACYDSKIAPELEKLANENRINVLYHQDFDSESFAKLLRKSGIDTLIYSGFASNICVVGRELGIIPMKPKGFRLFFVPEASAAVEDKDSWHSGDLHKATTTIISQAFGELIDLEEFLSLPTVQ